jgi:hypothetical protein
MCVRRKYCRWKRLSENDVAECRKSWVSAVDRGVLVGKVNGARRISPFSDAARVGSTRPRSKTHTNTLVGIEYVLVNGTLVIDKGQHLGTKPEKFLREGPKDVSCGGAALLVALRNRAWV